MIAEVDITGILSMLIAKFVQLDVAYVRWSMEVLSVRPVKL